MKNEYAIARELVGFRSSALRVRVLRREAGLVWARTADLLDSGTHLTLLEEQIAKEESLLLVSHQDGLVTFEVQA